MGADWQPKWDEKKRLMGHMALETFRQNEISRHILNRTTSDTNQLFDWLHANKFHSTKPGRLTESLDLYADCKIGSPLGFEREGRFFTRSSLEYGYMTSQIAHELGYMFSQQRTISVLEIGGGYGGLARALNLRVPFIVPYHLIDAPPVLAIQKWFLDRAAPDLITRFHDRTLNDISDHSVDLVINTRSFGEMDRSEVDSYFEQFERVVKSDAIMYLLAFENKFVDFKDLPLNGWEGYVNAEAPAVLGGRKMREWIGRKRLRRFIVKDTKGDPEVT